MDNGVVFFIIAIIIIGILVFLSTFLTGRHGYKFNTKDYQARFLKIENNLIKNNPTSYPLAIIEGDKLIDKALTELGISGKTMGERLKKSRNRFSDINSVWRAHKLRNIISHEPDYELNYLQAKRALEIYKTALKDLGAI